MSRCIVLMATLALVVSSAYAQAPVVKVTPKAVVVVQAAPAVAPANAAPAPAAPAPVAKAVAASQPVIAEPKTASEAVDTAKQGFDFAKARNWFGLSACAIFILMFVLNAIKVFDKIGKRWAYIILPVLGVAAMLLSRFAGGLSWEAAIAVLTSAPVTGLLWDFVKRGILAQEPTTPMKPEPTK
jgi:hypothetical protein